MWVMQWIRLPFSVILRTAELGPMIVLFGRAWLITTPVKDDNGSRLTSVWIVGHRWASIASTPPRLQPLRPLIKIRSDPDGDVRA